MTYHYAVYRAGLLLTRTLTRGKAEKVALKYGDRCVVIEQEFIGGSL